jgi:hypothetical protein
MRRIELARRGDLGRPPSSREIKALVRRVRAGEPGALADLSALARLHPEVVAESTISDLCKIARMFLAEAISGRDEASEAAVRARLDLLEASLAGPDGGPATRLCAAAVAHAWGEHWAIAAAATKILGKTTPGDLRRQGAALSRYLSTLRTFARIQRLEGRDGS